MTNLCNLLAAIILWLIGPVETHEDLDGGSDEWMRAKP